MPGHRPSDRQPGRPAPMLASDGPAPADLRGWAAEVKWDGMRVLAAVDTHGVVTAYGRSGTNATARYPELGAVTALVAEAPLVLDGEVVALDSTGLPSFGRLQLRMGLAGPARIRTAQARTPVTFMIFDILMHRGTPVTGRPYLERRRLLERLDLPDDGQVAVPPVWVEDVQAGIEWTRERRMEGVIVKRLASRYQPGRRSPDWVKVKFRPSADVVIGGWSADLRGEPRSLLVGIPEADGLRYVGAVGSGLSAAARGLLLPLLRTAATDASPFMAGAPRPPPGIHWVLPLLQGEVHYAERTRDGILRQPAWKGLRGLAGE
ncbi:non-homologous end-joining DNA ligase [Streptomyces sp. NBC_01267]|uniref:non-homologous end-joining DNA ligase n=1 Tax=Streptomyces sp. NBC_01267 TaxID=2903805 RepID=UPI002E34F3AA|nr:non-homologous end-joining DNA ligase [Streptomyces sp. NBC_01267]